MLDYNRLKMRLNDDWNIIFQEDQTRTGFLQTKLKLPSGMTAEFGCDIYTDNIVTIHLTVYRKRKNGWPEDSNETTGKDGLLPAIWALECLEQLEYAIKDCKESSLISIAWNSNRLRNVYEKVLGRRGYYFQQFHNGKYLIKKINDKGQE